ncbi:noncanonical pyrimidine nucleotidase, YjjG family [Taibaiella soli]|uniref:Noncanonical pyrimidine nucleotidase, YjjG family n=2 Tax=Taibaiella soli TaxID=1649169 RepID=A0A2W2AE91_9BACT|nr:noncanonical pyrimidine nucleotidase, YjjG family [Taibaiella soli]
MYQAIFFDVDDTLLNFKLSSQSAFQKSFADFNLEYNDHIFSEFVGIDNILWAKQRTNEITIQEVVDNRFKQLFHLLKIDADAADMEHLYRNKLHHECHLESEVVETIVYLNAKYKLYVASNGFLTMQTARLKLANLFHLFSDLYVSDDIGFEKPDRRFFGEILKRSSFEKHQTLFIGDSLEADIKGASGADIDTCWYNPNRKENTSDVSSTMIIHELSQLRAIL